MDSLNTADTMLGSHPCSMGDNEGELEQEGCVTILLAGAQRFCVIVKEHQVTLQGRGQWV